MAYSIEMDEALFEELVVYDPFRKGHSWPGLKKQLEGHPTLGLRQPKSLRDRALLLMDRRHVRVKEQDRASGIAVPPASPIQSAIDEAILLKREADTEANPKPVVLVADARIAKAAEGLKDQPLKGTDSSASSPSTPRTSKPRRISTDFCYLLKLKITVEHEAREEDRKKKEEEEELNYQREVQRQRREEERQQREFETWKRQETERQRHADVKHQQLMEQWGKQDKERQKRENEVTEKLRADAAEERKLRREDLEMRRRELESREKREEAERNMRENREEAERKERDLLLSHLSEKLSQK